MADTSPDFHLKSFRIKHNDNKFLTKLLSKENPEYNSSFRVYYKDFSGAVPFTWETRPGTPKHHIFHQNSHIPPLTPPPSYYTNVDLYKNSGSKSKLFFLGRNNLKKPHLTKSPSSSSLAISSSSSFRDPTVRSNPCCGEGRRRFSSWGGDERSGGIGKKEKWFRGYSPVCIVKKVFLSIVRLRSA